jgi:hypothetical protein
MNVVPPEEEIHFFKNRPSSQVLVNDRGAGREVVELALCHAHLVLSRQPLYCGPKCVAPDGM